MIVKTYGSFEALCKTMIVWLKTFRQYKVIFTDRQILLTYLCSPPTWMQMLYIFGIFEPTMTSDVMYWMMRIKLSGWDHRESLQCMYQLWRGLCKALIESCHSPSSSSKHSTYYILSSSGSSTIIVLFYCTAYSLQTLRWNGQLSFIQQMNIHFHLHFIR